MENPPERNSLVETRRSERSVRSGPRGLQAFYRQPAYVHESGTNCNGPLGIDDRAG